MALNTPGRVLRLASAHTALGARLVEEAGFDGVWASSLEISTANDWIDSEAAIEKCVLPAAKSMAEAVSCPVVADIGTASIRIDGVRPAVAAFVRAGVAAVMMEDGASPKRNSLLTGRHELAPVMLFRAKLQAAREALMATDTLLIARVEALIAGLGITEALDRAHAYVSAGADAVMIHSKSDSPDEILTFIDEWDGSAPLVLVPTTYYQAGLHVWEQTRKVGMVIYANQGMRAIIANLRRLYQVILISGGTLEVEDEIAPVKDLLTLQKSCHKNRIEPGMLPSVFSPSIMVQKA
jgi:phosphoenolpyruvate phosphomutase